MRTFLKSIITLFCVTVAGLIADQFLRREGISRRDLLFLSDVLVGLVAASLVFVLSIYQRHKARIIADRLRVIAEMNHHIRNALQVIAYHAWTRSEQEIASMNQAVSRITWALQEILPQLPGGHPEIQPTSVNPSKPDSSSGRDRQTSA